MSIQSTIGNFTKNAGENARSILSKASNAINGLIGTATTGVNSIWSGGFAGIDEKNIDSLKQAIKSYCDNIDSIINGFNEQANLEIAYKGRVQQEAQEFLKSMKELLIAYVSLMKQSFADLDEALLNYQNASGELAGQISSNAQDIRQQAQAVKLD